MPSSTVTIGGITLQGHEVPSEIPFGGRQKIAKNVLIGGQRVPDAMGPDDCDIRWEGRFRGEGAKGRALALDAIRKSGAQVELFWGGLFFLVIVEEFEATYRYEFDLPYRIQCYVVDDGSGGGLLDDLVGGIGALIGADLGGVLSVVGGGVAAPLAAVATDLSDAIGAAGALDRIPLVALGALQNTAATALMAADEAVALGDAAITAALEPNPTFLPAPAFAASVLDTLDALRVQGRQTALRGTLGRIGANLSTIG